MKVSALEEYGIRCMVLLARQEGGSLTLPEISEAEGLSISYAGKLLNILKKAGLVKSVRGRLGGYALTTARLKNLLSAGFSRFWVNRFTLPNAIAVNIPVIRMSACIPRIVRCAGCGADSAKSFPACWTS